MFRWFLGIIFMIFLIAVIGNVVLEQFPSLVPLWEEFKMHIITLYEMSIVKYGTIATLMIIIAIVILVGSSNKKI
ncbi:hypothetical protein ACA30_13150 [Virgibacillus soli]|uniref:Uncharacterized protein n=1 Tax=Lederbergia galactosidilytica TaxID=217031 RepID=A0A0Q9YG68_9BACI|nr:hypothetical protein ACA30_13150 [Virgibacillus soli]KRG16834.1 hypothetical protein ACA29_02835 [Lederbergia galactosidilytica]